MVGKVIRLSASLVPWLVASAALRGEFRLASPFTDHMVLQQGMPVPVWGTADPGDKLTVEFAGQSKTVTAADDGNWRVDLAPLNANANGESLVVHGPGSEADRVQLDDVLVGEVWLCGGEAAMNFTVARTDKHFDAGVADADAEIAAADHPRIRMFTGEWTRAYQPQARIDGEWKVCTPENVREFSAVGYFFAQDLRHELNVPIGIVTLAYGGSTAQAWIRREAIEADPRLKPSLDAFDAKVKAYAPPTEDDFKRWLDAARKTEPTKTQKKGHKPQPRPDPIQDQHNPTVLFNGMTAPVIPFAIRGVLWDQGETVTPPRELFPLWTATLIRDWRTQWHRNSELAFYFCQLAGLGANAGSPEVRAWQSAALSIPGTGMAVTIDLGDESESRSRQLKVVANRLSRIALAKSYARAIEYSGPQLEGVTSLGGALQLKFSHAAAGLSDGGSPLKTFEVAGNDGKFVPAKALIDGDLLFVSSPDVNVPVRVRYAWSASPAGPNLYNSVGLPAAPFEAGVK